MKICKIFHFLSFLLLIVSNSANAQITLCDSEQHKQFDFWLGDWTVKDVDGKVVGHNKVYKILKDCAVSENWKGAKASIGKSYNFYDKQENKWHQTWIDNSGGALYLDGGLQGKVMVLEGKRPGKDGTGVIHRIAYTPLDDGRVKQHWTASKDDGKTWKDLFVGFYEK